MESDKKKTVNKINNGGKNLIRKRSLSDIVIIRHGDEKGEEFQDKEDEQELKMSKSLVTHLTVRCLHFFAYQTKPISRKKIW